MGVGVRDSARARVLASLDIGTNSIRMEVSRIEPDQSISTLSQQREMVRLGQSNFASGRLSAAAIERGVLVCTRFAEVARGFGAEQIIALATSAVREAENQEEFLSRVREEAGIDVRVISGREEARLIYLGVVSGASLEGGRALFIDIGGGSTELIIGDSGQHHALESLKLGAIRLTERFLGDDSGPVSSSRFERMKRHARGVGGQTARRLLELGFETVYGSAGTITNLASVTARRLGDNPATLRNYVVQVSDLEETVLALCRLPLAERRRVPGLDAERADIILGGAAVLMALLEDLAAQTVTVSDRGLRHGIILDALLREEQSRIALEQAPVRLRSILQLCRACGFDEEHARQVQRIAFRLFDELGRLGLHSYGPRERELLGYAALSHDIGYILSRSGHERHGYYLLRHSDLLGFNDEEIAIMANLALYHRKSAPKKRHPSLKPLSKPVRRMIRRLSAILRVAEALDRSHLGLIRDLRATTAGRPRRLALELQPAGECDLEVWAIQQGDDPFHKAFGLPLEVRIPPAERDG